MSERFSAEHVETWRREGCAPIHNFFTPEEVAAVRADFYKVFGRAEGGADEALDKKQGGQVGQFHPVSGDGVPHVADS